jgi:hypothetical protein
VGFLFERDTSSVRSSTLIADADGTFGINRDFTFIFPNKLQKARILLEKPLVAQLPNAFPTFH